MDTNALTQAEYGRARGLSRARISQYKGAGLLVMTEDGRVDVAATDQLLSESLNPARVAGAQTSAGAGRSQLLQDAVLRDRIARARKTELEAGLLEGTLVRRADVEHMARGLGLQARDALMTIPDRMSPMLATESDPSRVHQLLTEELRRVALLIAQAVQEGSP